MKPLRNPLEVGGSYFVNKMPRSPLEHRGLEPGSVVSVVAVGSSWCDVKGADGRTFRIFGDRLRRS